MTKSRQFSERTKITLLVVFILILGVVIGTNAILENKTNSEVANSTSSADEGKESPQPAEEVTSVPDSPSSASSEVITSENSPEFAAILASSNDDTALFRQFAAKFAGREISFDGVIAYMQPHGEYKTRFDFLIVPGDSTDHSTGPSFKFEDKNVVYDMHFSGSNIPEYIAVGDKFRFTARIVGYSSADSTLFMLEPVKTKGR